MVRRLKIKTLFAAKQYLQCLTTPDFRRLCVRWVPKEWEKIKTVEKRTRKSLSYCLYFAKVLRLNPRHLNVLCSLVNNLHMISADYLFPSRRIFHLCSLSIKNFLSSIILCFFFPSISSLSININNFPASFLTTFILVNYNLFVILI